jgi:hypothetical protein
MNRTTALTITVALAGLALPACDRRSDSTSTAPSGTGTTSTSSSTNPSTNLPRTDRTDRTDRPRTDTPSAGSSSTGTPSTGKTPEDQSEKPEDIRITAAIRRAVIDDANLSTVAKNCKIITSNGVVTLRGAVNSEEERSSIDSKARAVAGVSSVTNELEIKPQ